MQKPRRRHIHRSPEEIASILAEFDRSGQSAVSFAREQDLALSSFRFWLSRRGKTSKRAKSTALVPVTIAAGGFAPSPFFEVALAGGRTLRFPRGVAPGELAAIVDALDPCLR